MYEYKGCGFRGVFLTDGYTIVDTPYGSGVTITDIDRLHAAIADELVEQEHEMTGQQFRFLRKQLGLTQEHLTPLFGVDVQTIANWEKRQEEAIPRTSSLAMRYVYKTASRHGLDTLYVQHRIIEDDGIVFARANDDWLEKKEEIA
ncbi:transcriptional regulator [Pseudomonas veronii]|jgi:DNA-binding transcriptional regulator YiaG|uniref:Transcriptional regulator n=2 Tax=Pseudomonas fluorescens group TaxID=136843 RepID=A0A0W0HMV5_PSEFL|nr:MULTISPECIES: transcriptional regulator [Pseudomonas]KTB62489.1 hypothetical protein AO063_14520 [Pseudomonas fluorescens ICMP 11288]NMY01175.1 transcriptional regulator [Pseudomonas veronii]OPK01859.1 transcriptional regulator [Pseudomonas veronii]SEC70233.1 hypothetical protein SAMN04490199_5418 [Pseudomonas marginalis]